MKPRKLFWRVYWSCLGLSFLTFVLTVLLFWLVKKSAIIILTVLLILLSGVLSWVLTRRITKPIRIIADGVEAVSEGQFRLKLPLFKIQEFKDLAKCFNHMAKELDDRIQLMLAEQNEKESMLTGMVEGVVTIDLDETIHIMNPAAKELLSVSRDASVIGRPLTQVVRNTDLQKMIRQALTTTQLIEKEVVLIRKRRQHIQVHGVALRNSRGETTGALVVLNDVTRIRHYESTRRQFVANVSHELKTPITLIKGFLETLQSPNLKPEEHAEFLEITVSHVDRLNSIIDDLLALSRIERGNESRTIKFEQGGVVHLIEHAIGVCNKNATARRVQIHTEFENHGTIQRNPNLLEQAIINLIDNAIKYSPEGSEIWIRVKSTPKWLEIKVEDQGIGIPESQIQHLFERFYRVDRARSREMGGTGLGLAIVKHIIQTHGGEVGVESILNKGSVFTLRLPLSESQSKFQEVGDDH